MTAQWLWSPRALARIREGVQVGIYHAGFPFVDRYRQVLAAGRDRDLSLYEKGLLAGYRSATRNR